LFGKRDFSTIMFSFHFAACRIIIEKKVRTSTSTAIIFVLSKEKRNVKKNPTEMLRNEVSKQLAACFY